jgi:hypothetical protein
MKSTEYFEVPLETILDVFCKQTKPNVEIIEHYFDPIKKMFIFRTVVDK